MAESAEGEVRYLLSDGLGSIRQAVDENGDIVSYDESNPYGNPLTFHALYVCWVTDTGGKVKGYHIDIFVGEKTVNDISLISSQTPNVSNTRVGVIRQ